MKILIILVDSTFEFSTISDDTGVKCPKLSEDTPRIVVTYEISKYAYIYMYQYMWYPP